MTPIVDCHTHTFYSDGQDSPEANVAAAAKQRDARCLLPRIISPFLLKWILSKRLVFMRKTYLVVLPISPLPPERHPSVEVVYGFECDW